MKKKSIIAIVAIVLLALIIVGIILLTKVFGKPNREQELIKLTKDFYGYYYKEVAKTNDVEKFLKGYKDTGLKINLANIETYLDGQKGENGDYSVFNNCDIDKTSVTIYPKSPYGKKDIEIKVNLECK